MKKRSSPSFFLYGRYFFSMKDALPGGEHVCQRHIRAGESLTRELFTTKRYRKTIDYYSFIFQDLVDEGFLSSDSKALCVETLASEDVVALREIGLYYSVGISKNPSPSLVFSGEAYRHPSISSSPGKTIWTCSVDLGILLRRFVGL